MPRGQHVFFDHAHDHQGHPFVWFLLLVLFAALVVLAIYTLIRLTRGGGGGGAAPAAAGPDAAVESVRMRYARGEIDRDEFVRVATDLGAPPPAAAV